MLLLDAGPQGSTRDWSHFNTTGPEDLFVQSISMPALGPCNSD